MSRVAASGFRQRSWGPERTAASCSLFHFPGTGGCAIIQCNRHAGGCMLWQGISGMLPEALLEAGDRLRQEVVM